jgi:hypothetical protein
MKRKAKYKPRAGNDVALRHPPMNLASIIRGLYRRVSRQLHVDPSYVSRVARGERRSKIIQEALRRELIKILVDIKKRRIVPALKTSRKKAAKKIDFFELN